uniref:Uncharacterized protein n=1 Tax=Tetranychus urticae TaxID=32264 RepID=T1JPP8_TETUR
MSSLIHQHIREIFMLPSKLISKFQEWIYGYIKLVVGLACSVTCLFCVFTFIWYLTIRGLYSFLINFQCIQTNGCDNGDVNGLNIDYAEYQPGKRKSFLTRCRAQAELIQKEHFIDNTTNLLLISNHNLCSSSFI